ncbi:MAG TPA: YigZ family protein [Firmicutes bacterium]|jgi:uncharacterized YigZ family protein|nr:YigZ family protein [Bacillota bacterium]HOQ24479.1 YigZ family protein [Bacillota bacterium]HPT67300.1 YigZ family protein [Bacillota bacterium]
MAPEYWVIAQETHHEIRIERSRFIGHATLTASEEEAKAFIGAIRRQYADATHNCYAYRVGLGTAAITYYHDHGEPTGTAGKPILNAILQANLFHTTVVVTRYFGGKKLGVRGLIDAYHQTAAETLAKAGRSPWVEGCAWELTLPYANWQNIQNLISRHKGKVLNCSYAENVHCRVWLPSDSQLPVTEALSQMEQVVFKPER